MPLLCTEGGEEEPHVGLIATEDGGPKKSDAMILALTPDEAFVVDVARGLDGGAVVEPAHGILVKKVAPPTHNTHIDNTHKPHRDAESRSTHSHAAPARFHSGHSRAAHDLFRRRPTVSAITWRKAMLRALYGRECLEYICRRVSFLVQV